MPLYDTTNMTASSNIYDYTVAVNQVVDYTLGMGIILTVFVITFIYTSKEYDSIGALMAASLVGLLSATILLPLNLITFDIYKIMLLITGTFVFIKFLTKQ